MMAKIHRTLSHTKQAQFIEIFEIYNSVQFKTFDYI